VSKRLDSILPTLHHSEPYVFSFHPVQPLLLSSSYKEVIIWNLLECTCVRVLKGIQDSEIQNVCNIYIAISYYIKYNFFY